MTNTQPPTIKKYVSSLASIVRSRAQNSLGSVLSRVRSSHEAVFIFDNNDEFLGLISPFKTLYSSNFPYTTKVSSIVFKPPAITEETPVYQVAEYMLSTKIYILPVLSKDGDLQSVIYGKDILQGIIKDPGLLVFVSGKVKPHIPITAPITASVKDVFYDLKEKGVSRMVIVNAEGSLAGIVTRSDLMQALIKPTAKMRFPKEGTHVGFYSLAGEKKFRKSDPIRKYYTVLVDSLPDDTSRTEIVSHLITSPHDSIILVDKHNKPTGFLSTRDILRAVVLLRPEEDIPLIIIKKPGDSVSNKELEQATRHLELFGRKLKKRMKIKKIEVTSEEPKNPKGHTMMFNITVIVTPIAGKAIVAATKQRRFIDGIQEATTLIEKQRRRSGLSKKDTRKS
ncbi:inosine 5-monophosphate dehydrogenase [Candidatus Kuenenia stuttgartiensis]|jgi:CBS domain-containing protein|nr:MULTISPECIES: CBS domain-containing protein [Kuenenia]MBE7546837.1 CBS domain-containing protein [Planctomycetia bacterium]MBZ0191764.1 CBS domain-containing protein [Candidatus Kuenenia stuttgartiensis]MCF6153254.1 CBS domain-containing protein [Candidatus Kuenenia stuttgartiensis]MCL4727952.1 CBS domain-containing protein [Candidatus Kuenenia stuttgartiensis]MCZ7623231.1 CBS domain-containing protein [Candidatus Kuenenia sp.]